MARTVRGGVAQHETPDPVEAGNYQFDHFTRPGFEGRGSDERAFSFIQDTNLQRARIDLQGQGESHDAALRGPYPVNRYHGGVSPLCCGRGHLQLVVNIAHSSPCRLKTSQIIEARRVLFAKRALPKQRDAVDLDQRRSLKFATDYDAPQARGTGN